MMRFIATQLIFLLLLAGRIAPTTSPTPKPKVVGSNTCSCEEENLETDMYWLDVVFVADTSNAVSERDFVTIEECLSLMTQLNLRHSAGDPQYTRLAIISVGEKAYVLANLTSDVELLWAVIQKQFKRTGGNVFSSSEGLRAAYNMLLLEKQSNVRENVMKVVVIFSSSDIVCSGQSSRVESSRDSSAACALASIMDSDGITLITIGLKMASDMPFPNINIASKCNTLDNTDDMITDLVLAFCRANCYCLEPCVQFAIGDDGCDKYGECICPDQMQLPYHSARATCIDLNRTLPTVFSLEKATFLSNLHSNNGLFPYWVGMTCAEGQCTADDGRPYGPGTYTNWCAGKGQPDFRAGECVYEAYCDKFHTGWFSDKCGTFMPMHYFSCQENSCSAIHYCDYPENRKISKRKGVM